jgi:hypothetical protein
MALNPRLYPMLKNFSSSHGSVSASVSCPDKRRPAVRRIIVMTKHFTLIIIQKNLKKRSPKIIKLMDFDLSSDCDAG